MRARRRKDKAARDLPPKPQLGARRRGGAARLKLFLEIADDEFAPRFP
jgi:hypothetical protein